MFSFKTYVLTNILFTIYRLLECFANTTTTTTLENEHTHSFSRACANTNTTSTLENEHTQLIFEGGQARSNRASLPPPPPSKSSTHGSFARAVAPCLTALENEPCVLVFKGSHSLPTLPLLVFEGGHHHQSKTSICGSFVRHTRSVFDAI